MVCRNPELAKLRGHKREDLLSATEEALRTIQARITAGRLNSYMDTPYIASTYSPLELGSDCINISGL